MTIMLAHLNDALRKAGVDEEVARKAAEEVAGYETRINGVEIKVGSIDAKATMLQWMVGINMAMTTAILFKVFA